MKGKALERRSGGGVLRKYIKIFPKRLGKDTKILLCDMMVAWSTFEPDIPKYKQEASAFQSNFSTSNFSTLLKYFWCSRINKYNNFIEIKIKYNNSIGIKI